jgi:hypothetical protein
VKFVSRLLVDIGNLAGSYAFCYTSPQELIHWAHLGLGLHYVPNNRLNIICSRQSKVVFLVRNNALLWESLYRWNVGRGPIGARGNGSEVLLKLNAIC